MFFFEISSSLRLSQLKYGLLVVYPLEDHGLLEVYQLEDHGLSEVNKLENHGI
jgi:hypothetical protein